MDTPSLIVGGSSTQVGEFPYYVDLDGCGGSLVAPGVVLTAAHCAEEDNQFSFNGATVIVGGTDRQQVTNNAQEATVIKSVMHPAYDPEATYMDVMLLQLDSPITTSGSVNLLLNSASSVPADGETLTVIGTGDTSSGGTQSDQLLQVDVPTVNTDTCNGPYEGEVFDDVMFCAGGVGGEDSCQGDSGGPIVIQETTDTHVQVGIVSWGDDCAKPGVPGVYARVSAAMNFIAYATCNCFGVNEANICAYFDPNDNFSCEQGSGSPSDGGNDGDDGGDDDDDNDGDDGGDDDDDNDGDDGGVDDDDNDGDGDDSSEGGTGPGGCELIPGWVDEYNDGCGWYEDNEDPGCANYGSTTGSGGYSAHEACCHCVPCSSYPNWTDSYDDGCDFYEEDGACDEWGSEVGTDEITAADACVACGACY